MGGRLYRLDGDTPRKPAREPFDLELCDKIYRALLAACPLSATHRAWLTRPANGLPADQLGLYG
jgi:hypothetical protein